MNIKWWVLSNYYQLEIDTSLVSTGECEVFGIKKWIASNGYWVTLTDWWVMSHEYWRVTLK